MERDPKVDPKPSDKLRGPMIGLRVETLTQEQSAGGIRTIGVLCSLFLVVTGKELGKRSFTLSEYRQFAGGEKVEVLHVAT